MKTVNLPTFAKAIRGSVLTLCLVILPFAVSTFAQNNNNGNVRIDPSPTRVVERDDDTDWGWIGLLGLAGLAGLLRKPQRDVVVHRDTDTRRP